MKKVLVISSSPRKDGNSETLAKSFMQGAVDAGHDVELICLRDYKIGYCNACYACSKLGRCCQKDDMNALAEKLLAADVIAWATPVYFYTMSAQLKTFIDRLVPWYTQIQCDNYLFCTAWDPETANLQLTLDSIRGCTRDCFEGCTEKGALAVGDVQGKGEIQTKNAEALQKAYKMGKAC